MPPKKTAPEIRFWAKVQKTDDCWLWMAGKGKDGYGVFHIDRRTWSIPAHTFLVGKAPNGLVWDHLCRVRHCVNPAHLEAITNAENVNRGAQRTLKTHCANGHLWIPENIRQGPKQKHCILCERERNRARYAANPEKARARVRVYYETHREDRLTYAKQYAHRSRSKPCRTTGCDNPKAPGKGQWYCKTCLTKVNP